MKIPQSCSWTWRKLLQLRPLLINHIRVKLGNGASTSFWFDPWLGSGPICKNEHDRVILESGLGRGLMVGDLTLSGEFAWPFPNCNGLWDLQTMARPRMTAEADRLHWLPQGKEFTVRLAWDSIRVKGDKVPWVKLVWASPTIPKCSFIAWLALRGKLLTFDKLQNRGVHLANRCVLCLKAEECLDHIFASCPFSSEVWGRFRHHFLHVPHEMGWTYWTVWASGTFIGKSATDKSGRLLTRTIIYHLWKERNARIHGDPSRSSLLIHGDIQGMMDIVFSSSLA